MPYYFCKQILLMKGVFDIWPFGCIRNSTNYSFLFTAVYYFSFIYLHVLFIYLFIYLFIIYLFVCRSQWPRCLRRRSLAARLLKSWVRIPPQAWMFVCCKSCVLSGRGLWDELITRPEESYRLWCVVLCDLETLRMRRPCSALGRSATKIFIYSFFLSSN